MENFILYSTDGYSEEVSEHKTLNEAIAEGNLYQEYGYNFVIEQDYKAVYSSNLYEIEA